jgi:hypothetical protein
MWVSQSPSLHRRVHCWWATMCVSLDTFRLIGSLLLRSACLNVQDPYRQTVKPASCYLPTGHLNLPEYGHPVNESCLHRIQPIAYSLRTVCSNTQSTKSQQSVQQTKVQNSHRCPSDHHTPGLRAPQCTPSLAKLRTSIWPNS